MTKIHMLHLLSWKGEVLSIVIFNGISLSDLAGMNDCHWTKLRLSREAACMFHPTRKYRLRSPGTAVERKDRSGLDCAFWLVRPGEVEQRIPSERWRPSTASIREWVLSGQGDFFIGECSKQRVETAEQMVQSTQRNGMT